MFPWFWYWMPQLHFPFSGSVMQDIAPVTDLFGAIKPDAGIGSIEKEIFDIVSYGRQLGWITEVLLHLADDKAIGKEKAQESLKKLIVLYGQIEEVKTKHRRRQAEATIALLEKLKASDPEEFKRVLQRFSDS